MTRHYDPFWDGFYLAIEMMILNYVPSFVCAGFIAMLHLFCRVPETPVAILEMTACLVLITFFSWVAKRRTEAENRDAY